MKPSDKEAAKRVVRDAALAGLGLAGLLAGYQLARAGYSDACAHFAEEQKFTVWTLLIAAQSAFWAVMLVAGFQWIREIRSTWKFDRAAFLLASGSSVIVVTLLFLVLLAVRREPDPLLGCVAPRTQLALLIGLLVATPSLFGMRLIQVLAERMPGHSNEGVEAKTVSSEEKLITGHLLMERRLRGFLTLLGAMVSLVVLATGAMFNAVNGHYQLLNPDIVGPLQPELVLLYGGLFTVGLGLVYLPAHRALLARGWAIIDALCPLPSVADARFAQTYDDRTKLATMLKLQGTTKENIEKAVVVFAPLLSGLIGSFVPK